MKHLKFDYSSHRPVTNCLFSLQPTFHDPESLLFVILCCTTLDDIEKVKSKLCGLWKYWLSWFWGWMKKLEKEENEAQMECYTQEQRRLDRVDCPFWSFFCVCLLFCDLWHPHGPRGLKCNSRPFQAVIHNHGVHFLCVAAVTWSVPCSLGGSLHWMVPWGTVDFFLYIVQALN